MHVVQPYPASANPSSSSGAMSPAFSRYAVTAFEPGASEVLTVGDTRSPRATALRASRAAPTITVGFDVFVQEVMAAIATDPVRIVARSPSTSTATLRYPRAKGTSATGAAGAASAIAVAEAY